MAQNVSAENVFNRARSLLNDRSGQIWTDSALAEYFKDAVNWMYNSIISVAEQTRTTASTGAIPYSPGPIAGDEQSLAAQQPADLYFPIHVWWKQSPGDDWTELDRVDTLQTQLVTPIASLATYTWRSRVIYTVSGTESGFLRFEYIPLLPVPTGNAQDQIGMDNVIEALGAYVAGLAYGSRGQVQQSAMMMGRADPPVGALGYREQLLQIIVKQEQGVARRGVRFWDQDYDEATRYGGI